MDIVPVHVTGATQIMVQYVVLTLVSVIIDAPMAVLDQLMLTVSNVSSTPMVHLVSVSMVGMAWPARALLLHVMPDVEDVMGQVITTAMNV